jgi:ArsR family metal-binding transcriptional regulator
MILKSYNLEIFNNECMPGAMTVQCYAHLDQDVSRALPFLNAALGGFQYTRQPPSVSFRAHGKLISVSGRRIAVNALKDEDEAGKIVAWIQREINAAWENRQTIEPRYEGTPKVQVIEILKLLPMTNCRQCGAPTCMVFATQVADGAKTAADCPPMEEKKREKLNAYLAPFELEL